jgi:sterol desaturase/sphingolipid hydroxylase (fatty acid hydroxylase superfamily)
MLPILTSFLIGVFSWTFAEYAIHNWVGHLGRGRNEFSREHLAHHRDGNYFASAGKKALMASTVLVFLVPLSILAAGWVLGVAFSVGFIGTYVGYEVLHRRCHTHAPVGPYGRWVRRHHFYHHFSTPKLNHGVTSPLWDVVFRTYRAPGQIRVPERHAMTWLVDPETGEVWDRYARDYVIARKGDKKRRLQAA